MPSRRSKPIESISLTNGAYTTLHVTGHNWEKYIFVLAVHHIEECTRLGLINQLSAGYIPAFLQVLILLLHSGSSLHIDRRIDKLTAL